MNLNRREAIIQLAVLMGASVVGPRLFGAKLDGTPESTFSLTSDDLALLDEIGETIIPATDTPGAKAVGIGAFMAMMVRDCYSPREQAVFKAGLKQIATTFEQRNHTSFIQGSPADRKTLLNELNREQHIDTEEKKKAREPLMLDPEDDLDRPPPHFFRMMKDLTVIGYFSSEIGCTQAVRFIEVPGRFDGGAPYLKGEHAWFS